MLLADAWIESLGPTGQTLMHVFFGVLISLLSIFLILLVLVQRGRGGGLAGALGGMGGQSAFGTRAGDTFTWITYATAAVWIFLAMLTIKTFTDPVQDRADMVAEREERPEDDTSVLPRGMSDDSDLDPDAGTGNDLPPSDSEGAKTDDPSSEVEKSDSAADKEGTSSTSETPSTDNAKSDPATNKESTTPDNPKSDEPK